MIPSGTTRTLREGCFQQTVAVLRSVPGDATGDTLYLIEEENGRTGWWCCPWNGYLGDQGTGDRHATLW